MTALDQPGADWVYVDEGEELTTEQATRRFLDQEWPEQLRMMELMREDLGAASHCRTQNHEGAVIFATRHSCALLEPVTIEGETVEAKVKYIDEQGWNRALIAPAHQCEDWQLSWRRDGWLYCRACGADIGHDPQMQVNE